MIETHMQQQQQDAISQQSSYPCLEAETGARTGPTITCRVCDAVYAPSSQQAPFLQYTQGTLEATFMGMCHFCFRCRRAACPQCWDEVHGVCGVCVREAGLPFRAPAVPLDGLMFPPTGRPSSQTSQPQASSLFVTVRNGRFYYDTQTQPEPIFSDISTEQTPAVKPAASQNGAPDSQVAGGLQDDTGIAIDEAAPKTGEHYAGNEDQIDTPATIIIPTKIPTPEDSQETDGQEKMPGVAKKVKKVSRLEKILTWIVLVIVVALVVVIALAEFIPAVNVTIAHVTHIDIHGEIAYLVHIVQQLFKR